jgi:hypothetical protein
MASGRINHPTSYLFLVVDVKSLCHSKENISVVWRGFSYVIMVIRHDRVSVLPLGHAEDADQTKEVCDGMAQDGGCGCLHMWGASSAMWIAELLRYPGCGKGGGAQSGDLAEPDFWAC